jgi:SAM-dependent methyltransferase
MIGSEERNAFFLRPPATVRRLIADFRGECRDVEILDYLEPSPHYSGSFGMQWNKYRHVQIDRFNGTQLSHEHLRNFTLGDLEILKDKIVLEIGSGAGRFTDYLVDLAHMVITVDPSAIFANVALGAQNLIPIRADLFDVPVKRETIDVVFCRGVTQHTADTRRAVIRLFDYVRPGGVVLFDVYNFKWFTPFCTKYWIRPFTRRIPVDSVIRVAEKWVPRLMRFKNRFVTPLLPNNKLGVNIANQIVPIADYTKTPGLMSWEQRVEWSVLDTVDMYTPRYDRPMTWNGIMRALHEVGATDIKGDRSSFCFRAAMPVRQN